MTQEQIITLIISITPAAASLIASISTVVALLKNIKNIASSINMAQIRADLNTLVKNQIELQKQLEATKQEAEYYRCKALHLYVDPELEKKYAGK